MRTNLHCAQIEGKEDSCSMIHHALLLEVAACKPNQLHTYTKAIKKTSSHSHPQLCKKTQKASLIWKEEEVIVTFQGTLLIKSAIFRGDNRRFLHRLRLAPCSSCTILEVQCGQQVIGKNFQNTKKQEYRKWDRES